MARGAGCCVALLFGLAIVCLLVPPLNPPHPWPSPPSSPPLSSWGLISSLTGFVRSAPALYFSRFLLGFPESVYYPGCIVALSLWFPSEVGAFKTPSKPLQNPFKTPSKPSIYPIS